LPASGVASARRYNAIRIRQHSESTINNQQSTINNQQSAISNQQSAISNQQSAIGNRQSAIGNVPAMYRQCTGNRQCTGKLTHAARQRKKSFSA